jgi:alkanesulfonate monooxygenase SsuD/methylene tetrahydromethanopterin reductase-like flavin-dependent oxidoreductase (luciferase family)
VTSRLRIGIQLPEVERVVRWPELKAMAVLAEQVGFDSLWLGDHLLYRYEDGPRGPWEAWSMLAALAAATSRVELGPLVACTSFHNPAMLAKKAAAVDEISGGRLILGLGAGWNEPEYEAYGFPFDHRVSRFAEAFTIIRKLLREGHVDFAGEYYQARDCELLPRGPRPAGPPLMVGSMGQRMLALTLPHVDSWNAWYAWFGNDVGRLAGLLADVDTACAAVGRDPAQVERTAAVLVRMPGGTGRDEVDERGRLSHALTGAPEEIAAGLRAFAAAGIGHVQLVVDPITEQSIAGLAPVLELVRAASAPAGGAD